MKPLVTQRLEIRLIVTVGLGLLVFSLLAGAVGYHYAYRYQLDVAQSLQQQLVRTVQAQAEVAAFAVNDQIAQGVLNGLIANPVILAARIETPAGYQAELGSHKNIGFAAGSTYPLYSPVDAKERIGTLLVVQDDAQVHRAARQAAVFQALLMLTQVLVTALIMAVVLRSMVIAPIARLAKEMVAIQPGDSTRLAIAEEHLADEIGLLAKSANTILDAAETAIAEVTAQRNELEKTATHDYLTGLPTMRLAEDRLLVACKHALRADEKIALLFIDLDNFKSINDDYGHQAGDEALQEMARRLQDNIRAEDTAARIGGDEFMIILAGLRDKETAVAAARNLCTALAQPLTVAGHAVQLGASIGIALFPDHTGDVKEMRRMADQAMYTVKKSGKGDVALAERETIQQGEFTA